MNLPPYITSREKEIYRLIRAAVPVRHDSKNLPRDRADFTRRVSELFHRNGRHEVALSTNDRLRAARAVVEELLREEVLIRCPGDTFRHDKAALEVWASVWRAAEKLRKEPA